jgi:hypothetical protein
LVLILSPGFSSCASAVTSHPASALVHMHVTDSYVTLHCLGIGCSQPPPPPKWQDLGVTAFFLKKWGTRPARAMQMPSW